MITQVTGGKTALFASDYSGLFKSASIDLFNAIYNGTFPELSALNNAINFSEVKEKSETDWYAGNYYVKSNDYINYDDNEENKIIYTIASPDDVNEDNYKNYYLFRYESGDYNELHYHSDVTYYKEEDSSYVIADDVNENNYNDYFIRIFYAPSDEYNSSYIYYEKDIVKNKDFIKAQLEELEYNENTTYYIFNDLIFDLQTYFTYINYLIQIDEKYSIIPQNNEGYFDIDMNSRSITIPSKFSEYGLGMAGDIRAETVYFKVDRYFDIVDLNDTKIVIQWKNANGDTGATKNFVKNLLIEPGKIVFGWPISADIMEVAGDLQFAVRFYKEDNGEIIYSLMTKTATVTIQEGLNDDFSLDNIDNTYENDIFDIVENGTIAEIQPSFTADLPETLEIAAGSSETLSISIDLNKRYYGENFGNNGASAKIVKCTWYKDNEEISLDDDKAMSYTIVNSSENSIVGTYRAELTLIIGNVYFQASSTECTINKSNLVNSYNGDALYFNDTINLEDLVTPSSDTDASVLYYKLTSSNEDSTLSTIDITDYTIETKDLILNDNFLKNKYLVIKEIYNNTASSIVFDIEETLIPNIYIQDYTIPAEQEIYNVPYITLTEFKELDDNILQNNYSLTFYSDASTEISENSESTYYIDETQTIMYKVKYRYENSNSTTDTPSYSYLYTENINTVLLSIIITLNTVDDNEKDTYRLDDMISYHLNEYLETYFEDDKEDEEYIKAYIYDSSFTYYEQKQNKDETQEPRIISYNKLEDFNEDSSYIPVQAVEFDGNNFYYILNEESGNYELVEDLTSDTFASNSDTKYYTFSIASTKIDDISDYYAPQYEYLYIYTELADQSEVTESNFDEYYIASPIIDFVYYKYTDDFDINNAFPLESDLITASGSYYVIATKKYGKNSGSLALTITVNFVISPPEFEAADTITTEYSDRFVYSNIELDVDTETIDLNEYYSIKSGTNENEEFIFSYTINDPVTELSSSLVPISTIDSFSKEYTITAYRKLGLNTSSTVSKIIQIDYKIADFSNNYIQATTYNTDKYKYYQKNSDGSYTEAPKITWENCGNYYKQRYNLLSNYQDNSYIYVDGEYKYASSQWQEGNKKILTKYNKVAASDFNINSEYYNEQYELIQNYSADMVSNYYTYQLSWTSLSDKTIDEIVSLSSDSSIILGLYDSISDSITQIASENYGTILVESNVNNLYQGLEAYIPATTFINDDNITKYYKKNDEYYKHPNDYIAYYKKSNDSYSIATGINEQNYKESQYYVRTITYEVPTEYNGDIQYYDLKYILYTGTVNETNYTNYFIAIPVDSNSFDSNNNKYYTLNSSDKSYELAIGVTEYNSDLYVMSSPTTYSQNVIYYTQDYQLTSNATSINYSNYYIAVFSYNLSTDYVEGETYYSKDASEYNKVENVTENNYTDYYIISSGLEYEQATTYTDDGTVDYYIKNSDDTFSLVNDVTESNYTNYYIIDTDNSTETETVYKKANEYDENLNYYMIDHEGAYELVANITSNNVTNYYISNRENAIYIKANQFIEYYDSNYNILDITPTNFSDCCIYYIKIEETYEEISQDTITENFINTNIYTKEYEYDIDVNEFENGCNYCDYDNNEIAFYELEYYQSNVLDLTTSYYKLKDTSEYEEVIFPYINNVTDFYIIEYGFYNDSYDIYLSNEMELAFNLANEDYISLPSSNFTYAFYDYLNNSISDSNITLTASKTYKIRLYKNINGLQSNNYFESKATFHIYTTGIDYTTLGFVVSST